MKGKKWVTLIDWLHAFNISIYIYMYIYICICKSINLLFCYVRLGFKPCAVGDKVKAMEKEGAVGKRFLVTSENVYSNARVSRLSTWISWWHVWQLAVSLHYVLLCFTSVFQWSGVSNVCRCTLCAAQMGDLWFLLHRSSVMLCPEEVQLFHG